MLLQRRAQPNTTTTTNGNTALAITKRLGYVSLVDTMKVLMEEVATTMTITAKRKLNVPETTTEVLDVSDEEGEDTMTRDGGEYWRPEDLKSWARLPAQRSAPGWDELPVLQFGWGCPDGYSLKFMWGDGQQ